ncbi:hypothetical protein FB451DRAFT_1243174 [Mycena latifolia]|nr:hypothetical protein FB451DRAFT_1243174 [Mycena latifolia]
MARRVLLALLQIDDFRFATSDFRGYDDGALGTRYIPCELLFLILLRHALTARLPHLYHPRLIVIRALLATDLSEKPYRLTSTVLHARHISLWRPWPWQLGGMRQQRIGIGRGVYTRSSPGSSTWPRAGISTRIIVALVHIPRGHEKGGSVGRPIQHPLPTVLGRSRPSDATMVSNCVGFPSSLPTVPSLKAWTYSSLQGR